MANYFYTKKTSAVRIFWKDNGHFQAQCPFCRQINKLIKASSGIDKIYVCEHLDDADWSFGKMIFKCQETGIPCPICEESFEAAKGIRLKDGQIICIECATAIELKAAEAIKYHEEADKYYCPDCLGKLEADGELAYENLLESLQEDDIKEVTNE